MPTTHVLRREQRLDAPIERVFAFFGDARNLEAITPPFLGFEVVTPEPIEMRVGTLIQYRLALHGIRLSWLTSIQAWEPDTRFVDVQLSGPYELWHHTHEFEPLAGGGTLMRDTVRYAIGFGALGEIARRAIVTRDLARIFDHRATAVASLTENWPAAGRG